MPIQSDSYVIITYFILNGRNEIWMAKNYLSISQNIKISETTF